jgi:hypothetical protein
VQAKVKNYGFLLLGAAPADICWLRAGGCHLAKNAPVFLGALATVLSGGLPRHTPKPFLSAKKGARATQKKGKTNVGSASAREADGGFYGRFSDFS